MIGQGGVTPPLVVTGRDELAELARALNAMCDGLAAAQHRIHQETAEKIDALEQLRHADRLKTAGVVASGIAHELGSPLNVISARAKLIATGDSSESEIRDSAVVILITAFGDEQIHAQAERFGAAAVFDKPFDVDDLLLKVRQILAVASWHPRYPVHCSSWQPSLRRRGLR